MRDQYLQVMEKSRTISSVYSEKTIKAISASLIYNEFEYNKDTEILSYWKSIGKEELKDMDWALKSLIKIWKREYTNKIVNPFEVRAFLFDNLCEYEDTKTD